MRKVIDLNIEKLEFEIAGKDFEVTQSDEMIVTVDGYIEKIQTIAGELGNESSDYSMDSLREVLKEGLDKVLGEGAFNHIEENMPHRFTPRLLSIFLLISQSLNQSIQQDVITESINKYKKPDKAAKVVSMPTNKGE